MEVEWEKKKGGRRGAAIVIKLFGSNGAATMREGERDRRRETERFAVN